jgi:hypothetical protein
VKVESEHPSDSWDQEEADSLKGSYVLVGVTWLASDGETIEARGEYHGRVVQVDRKAGIVIACEGQRAGETFTLPPASAPFHPADPGEYRLKSTGEVWVDPDFTATWTVTSPAVS